MGQLFKALRPKKTMEMLEIKPLIVTTAATCVSELGRQVSFYGNASIRHGDIGRPPRHHRRRPQRARRRPSYRLTLHRSGR